MPKYEEAGRKFQRSSLEDFFFEVTAPSSGNTATQQVKFLPDKKFKNTLETQLQFHQGKFDILCSVRCSENIIKIVDSY